MKVVKYCALLCLSGFLAAVEARAQIAHGVTLKMSVPDHPAGVALGNNINANVDISGLNGTKAASFAIQIRFIPSVVSVQSVTFGTGLNNGSPLGSIQSWNVSNNILHALVDVKDISLLGSLASQPTAFTLFTIAFKGVGPGISGLAFTQYDFTDQAGTAYFPAMLNNSQITVVPEPEFVATASGIGLLLLGGWRLRRRR